MEKSPSPISDWKDLSRPFTLLAPSIGFLSGAWMASAEKGDGWRLPWICFVGMASAATLNAASNVINQVCDLEIDRVNKPERPLPAGRVSVKAALAGACALYALAFALALPVGTTFTAIVAITLLLTLAYSVPPVRTKRFGVLANITIAIPRGMLIIVAGWSSLANPWAAAPWAAGGALGLFVLGAATTKDYADIEGDRKYGVQSLPVLYGVRTSAWMITPFFVLPYLLIPLATARGWLPPTAVWMAVLAPWGAFTAWLILRDPTALTLESNHVSWKHMYLMMMATQIGFIAASLAHYGF